MIDFVKRELEWSQSLHYQIYEHSYKIKQKAANPQKWEKDKAAKLGPIQQNSEASFVHDLQSASWTKIPH